MTLDMPDDVNASSALKHVGKAHAHQEDGADLVAGVLLARRQ
jgi:hypothetical protein